MNKFLIINIAVVSLFLIFMSSTSTVSLTSLGWALLAMIYVVINAIIYAFMRYFNAKKPTHA